MTSRSPSHKNDKKAQNKITVTLDTELGWSALELDQAIKHIRQEITKNYSEVAARHIKQLSEQLPESHPAPKFLQANYHSHNHEWQTALAALDAISDTHKDSRYYKERTKILLKMRQNKGAVLAIRQAIQLDPQNADGYLIAARIFKALGNMSKTQRFLDRTISLRPESHQAYIEKAHLPDAQFSKKELKHCLALADSTPNETVRYNLYFAVARHYANCADHKQEMAMLNRGNQIKAKTLNNELYIPQRQQFTNISQSFEKLSIDNCRLDDTSPAPLIFIVGFPRSGSTLTEQILSAHPCVTGAGESMVIPKALLKENRTNYPEWIAGTTQDDLSRLKQHIDSQLTNLYGTDNGSTQEEDTEKTLHLVEKSLDNVFYLGLIKLIYPSAKIVHTFKHPIDNCLGCYKQVFSGDAWRYIYSLDSLRDGYKNYHRVMQYWDDLFPDQIFHFRYESLIADQRAATQALLCYCGLDWSESCMDFHLQENNVDTASAWQIRQALNDKSIGRWQDYQSELASLLPLLELSQWQSSSVKRARH